MDKSLEFLSRTKPKTLRTVLYEDSLFDPFEIEILHTPVFQRLYGLKQLGFADKVYPDSVHSRFNHALGVCDRVGAILENVLRWLREKPNREFTYALTTTSDEALRHESLSGNDLCKHLAARKPVARLMGLLHDITHSAYGHTLEDELRIFAERHDAPPRQTRFYDALIAQLMWIWSNELGVPAEDGSLPAFENLEFLKVDRSAVKQRVDHVLACTAGHRKRFLEHLQNLELACAHLLRLDGLHKCGIGLCTLLLCILHVVWPLHGRLPEECARI